MRVIVTGEIPVPILAVILTTSFGGSVSLLELCWSQCISFPRWVSACVRQYCSSVKCLHLCAIECLNWSLIFSPNEFFKIIFEWALSAHERCEMYLFTFFLFFSLWLMTWDAYLIPNDNFLDKKSLSHYIWGCSSADFPILTIITQTIKYLSTPHL